MDNSLIKQQKQDIVDKYGKWIAHNIQLKDEIYTIANRVVGDEIKLRRILQIVADNARKSLNELRILDLACHEGLYAVELARHGAQVVGIEIRQEHLAKADFAKNVLSLPSLELIQDDVRNLSLKKYGSFDVVLCLGILYHLDAPDVFHFLEKIAEVCQGITIIDTHVSLSAKKPFIYDNKKYWGKIYREHSPFSSLAKRARALKASIDNPRSFWFTRRSLYNFLTQTGFTSVYECHNPPEPQKPMDRLTLLAIKGQAQRLITNPLANEQLEKVWPEK